MLVNIVGRGEGYQLAPEGPHTWGINDLFLSRKVTMVCEMHDFDWTMERLYQHQVQQKGHIYDDVVLRSKAARKRFLMDKLIAKINEQEIPVLSVKKYDYIPTSIEYPLDRIIAKYKTDYFSCGIAYMLAYALYVGATRLDLYGVCMYTTTEYIFQKPGVEYWCGIALGQGVEVNVCAPDGAVLQTRTGMMYGTLDKQIRMHYEKHWNKGLRGKGYNNLALFNPELVKGKGEERQLATRGKGYAPPRLQLQ